MRSDAPPERVVDGRAEAEPAGHAVLPVLEPPGAGRPARTGRPRRAAPRDDRAVTAGADRGSTCARRETRCRVDRAGTCGPSPPTGRSRSRRRRGDAGRPTDTRRAGTAHRPPASASPISAAGFTSPPLVGMWVSDTRATSCRASRSATASTSTWPYRSLGTRSIRHASPFGGDQERHDVRPVLVVVDDDRLTRCHRHRPERRVPRRGGVLGPSDLRRLRADQSGDRVVDGQTPIERRARGLVAAVDRLGLEVADLRVEDRPGAATTNRRG